MRPLCKTAEIVLATVQTACETIQKKKKLGIFDSVSQNTDSRCYACNDAMSMAAHFGKLSCN
jgi:hypothetical protein